MGWLGPAFPRVETTPGPNPDLIFSHFPACPLSLPQGPKASSQEESWPGLGGN